MSHIDIARLRKDHNMSQSQLAGRLQMTQSFLSAIENGKSPLPLDKEDRLLEIFSLSSLKDYIIENTTASDHTHKISEMTDSDLFNQLLSRFHRQAHSKEESHHHHDHHERIALLEEQLSAAMTRCDKLLERNDSLTTSNDQFRNEIDTLREEIYRLKSLLLSHGINF